MKLLTDKMMEKVAYYENNLDKVSIQELKPFVEELIITQVRAITYRLLKTLALSGWKVPNDYLWHLFMMEGNRINPIPDYENEEFKLFCVKSNEKIANSKHIPYDDLFTIPIKVLGGYLYFGDEGRINEFLACYNSYLHLYIPSNKQYRIKRIKEILDIPDNEKTTDLTYILGYTYPITSFAGERLFIFLKEEALSPLVNNNAEGNILHDTICIRQTIILKGMIDFQNSNTKAGLDFLISKGDPISVLMKAEQTLLSEIIKSAMLSCDNDANDTPEITTEEYNDIEGCLLNPLKSNPHYEKIRNQVYTNIYSTLVHEHHHIQSGVFKRKEDPSSGESLYFQQNRPKLSNMHNKYVISRHTIRKDILFNLHQNKHKTVLENIFKPFIDGYIDDEQMANLGCGVTDKISIKYEDTIQELKDDKLIIEDENGNLHISNFLNYNYNEN